MDCFENRIGIRGCDAPFREAVAASLPDAMPVVLAVEALPVLFINDLPGCPLRKFDSLTDDEAETYLAVWDKIAKRTLQKFWILVKSKLNQCYKLTDRTVVNCLICEHKDFFDLPLLYLHGVELMIEITSSDTLSRYTTIDLAKAESLKGEFYSEFTSFLDDAVQSINPADSDCVPGCLECNDSVKFVFQLP